MMELVDINTNDPMSTNYSIKLLCSNTKVVTKELIKARNSPNIVSIMISLEYYINKPNNLTQEKNENIMFPEVLSPLQQKFKSWHGKLSRLHPKSMSV